MNNLKYKSSYDIELDILKSLIDVTEKLETLQQQEITNNYNNYNTYNNINLDVSKVIGGFADTMSKQPKEIRKIVNSIKTIGTVKTTNRNTIPPKSICCCNRERGLYTERNVLDLFGEVW